MRTIPSFEEGREAQARQRAAVREVKPVLQRVTDLPRRTDFKVALRFA